MRRAATVAERELGTPHEAQAVVERQVRGFVDSRRTPTPSTGHTYDNVAPSTLPSVTRSGVGDYAISFAGAALSRGIVTVVPVGATWDLAA